MKNYLMAGIAVVAMVATFTSCTSHDFEPMTQGEIAQAKYDQAFLKYIGGTINKNQDWGFSATSYSAARTRAIDVNGNMWKDIPECTDAEKTKVFNYVNMTKAQMTTAGHYYTEVFPKNIQNYFVTQVYTGNDTYSTWDGSTKNILGSAHMDNLQIAMTDGAAIVDGALNDEGSWTHINNFNASSNTNYGGNTLVVDGGTFDFAYISSEDSRYHNKWIAVKGADIDPSLAGNYYICFDFIAENPEAYTNFKFKVPGINPGEWTEKGPIAVPGCWTVESATAANLVIEYSELVWNGEAGTNVEVKKSVTVGQEGTAGWSTETPVGGNKVIPANDVYTDWIVRIVEAQPEENYDLKIIAEDLSAGEDGDFDFNDIVLEVKYGSPAKVKLTHAGGTLPLCINLNENWETHKLFDVGEKTMVNTGAGPNKAPVVIEDFNESIANAAEANTKIKLYVKKGEDWQEMTAPKGEPACKLAVGIDFKVLGERTSIKKEYPLFVEWATGTNFTSKWWTTE